METGNPEHDSQLLVDTQASQNSTTEDTQKSGFDKVMRSLVSEVDEQRRQFDKKWSSLVQYLMRKQEEQEQLIRKLRLKVSQQESMIENMNGVKEHEGYKSDVGAKGAVPCSPVREKPVAEEEDIDDFDHLQSIVSERSNGSPTRKRRFYSLGNNIQPRSFTARQDTTRRLSLRATTYTPEKDFIEDLKLKLQKANAIIKRDTHHKTQLISKLREMKQEIDILKQQQQTSEIQVEQAIVRFNKKLQTEEFHPSVSDQVSVGINTEYIDLNDSQPKIKISPDQYEEHRLKQNIQFWKSKVDQLLQKQKETLQTHLIQQKQISSFELQVEELKTLLKLKDTQIEQLTLSKNMLEQRHNIYEMIEEKEGLLTDRMADIVTDNESSDIINDSSTMMNHDQWVRHQDIPLSSQASSIDHHTYTLKNNIPIPNHPNFYSPLGKVQSKKQIFQSVNKAASAKSNKQAANKTMYTVDLTQRRAQIKTAMKVEPTRQELYERSKTPVQSRNEKSNLHLNHKNSLESSKKGDSSRGKQYLQGNKSQATLIQKKSSNTHSRQQSKGKNKMNKSMISSHKKQGSIKDAINQAIHEHVIDLNDEDNIQEFLTMGRGPRTSMDTHKNIADRVTPMKQMRYILDTFTVQQETPPSIISSSNMRSPPKAMVTKNNQQQQYMSSVKNLQKPANKPSSSIAKSLKQSYIKPPTANNHKDKQPSSNTSLIMGQKLNDNKKYLSP